MVGGIPDRDGSERAPRAAGALLAAFALLCAGGLIHLACLTIDSTLDLSGDEAHYWEWSRRLDLAYYSKGPLVAYIIAAGRYFLANLSQRLMGNEVLAVRVPAILLSIGTGVGVFVLAVRTTRSSRLALAAVAIMFTIPILAAGAILMTIDAPLAFLFVWTLVALDAGLRDRRLMPWVAAGVLIALGILAKYTMLVIFPVLLLTLFTERGARGSLRQPGPYVAAGIALLGLLPILIWNSEHGWVSFRHVAGQAGVTGGRVLDWLGPVRYLSGQAAVIGPFWFAAMLWAMGAFWRRPAPAAEERHDALGFRLLLSAATVPWAGFLVFSFVTKVQPNWPVVAVLPGIVLVVAWATRIRRCAGTGTRRLVNGLLITAVVFGGTSVVALHRMEWFTPALAWLARREPPWNLTPVAKFDPTARLRGWAQLGREVGEVLRAEHASGRAPFIMADEYQTASQIAFYCPGQPTVYCVQSVLGNRQSQYDVWRPNPIVDGADFTGRPCVYVGARKAELFGAAGWSHVALPGARLARTVEHRVRGHLMQVWPVYVCDAFAGLPPELCRPAEKY